MKNKPMLTGALAVALALGFMAAGCKHSEGQNLKESVQGTKWVYVMDDDDLIDGTVYHTKFYETIEFKTADSGRVTYKVEGIPPDVLEANREELSGYFKSPFDFTYSYDSGAGQFLTGGDFAGKAFTVDADNEKLTVAVVETVYALN